MQENKIPNYIAIEGPIGVGKTHFPEKLLWNLVMNFVWKSQMRTLF